MKRRQALHALAGLGAGLVFGQARSAKALLPPAKTGRVVVVGGGWGGLSAAAHLRRALPAWDIVLIERQARFFSLPLSNAWLIDRVPDATLEHDYRKAAARHGYTFVQAEVRGIDRAARRIETADGRLSYDWLVLSPGIAENLDAWVGGDAAALTAIRAQFDGGFVGAAGVRQLKQRLHAFKGGDLLMTVPPPPYRCPPTPYERAIAIATWFKQHQIKGRLIVLDPGAGMAGFRDSFDRQLSEHVVFKPFQRIERVDPFKKVVVTDFDEFPFTDAILAGPQQAGALVAMAGLDRRNDHGEATGWADVDARTLQSVADERVFVIGDAVGLVSPLFGHYPKTGHMAVHHGRLAAATIAARVQGKAIEAPFPESTCWVYDSFTPPEMVRIDASYRIRGDGALEQTIDQARENQPRGEEMAWAEGMFGEMFGR